jgi:hypothetical protein
MRDEDMSIESEKDITCCNEKSGDDEASVHLGRMNRVFHVSLDIFDIRLYVSSFHLQRDFSRFCSFFSIIL